MAGQSKPSSISFNYLFWSEAIKFILMSIVANKFDKGDKTRAF
jgi:hypothetical protein